jgi:hypothetical protein
MTMPRERTHFTRDEDRFPADDEPTPGDLRYASEMNTELTVRDDDIDTYTNALNAMEHELGIERAVNEIYKEGLERICDYLNGPKRSHAATLSYVKSILAEAESVREEG